MYFFDLLALYKSLKKCDEFSNCICIGELVMSYIIERFDIHVVFRWNKMINELSPHKLLRKIRHYLIDVSKFTAVST